jgi:hypothetical protein
MLNPIWRRCLRRLATPLYGLPRKDPVRRTAGFRVRLEELESRLAPASFAVNAQLQITRLGEPIASTTGGAATGESTAQRVVFFESSVANIQVLRQGLSADTDSVALDSDGDGLMEMAAFLAGRHDLTSIGVVAHGAPGAVALGSASLNAQSLGRYGNELAVVGSALGAGGELDLWSCDVAAGETGASLVGDLALATGAGVAAADHTVGAETLGGNWRLDVQIGARGLAPFSANSLGAFHELLGTWSPAAPMATPRGLHTATLLSSGSVLVAGGETDGARTLSSAELYDPTGGTWSSAHSMISAREYQTATLLSNGKVLVAGGLFYSPSATTLSSAELYNPISDTWSPVASMATARYQHTATLLNNGKVLVAGGWKIGVGPLSSAEIYDPVSKTWSSAGNMTTARVNQTATVLNNGEVLVAGGSNHGALPSAELYDPVSNSWSSAGYMATARFYHTATLLSNGEVLVAGGLDVSFADTSSAELYDPATNTWSGVASMVTARDQHTATLLSNGTVLITGGAGGGLPVLSSAELYDPAADSWSLAGNMATSRADDTAILLNNGKVLVAGGGGVNGVVLSSSELYDPATPAVPATQFAITNLSATSLAAGGTASFTVTAEDVTGTPVPSYSGTVQLTSTDGHAVSGGNGLPASYTFVASDNGAHTFTVVLETSGSQTITATDRSNKTLTVTTSPITVNSGSFSEFVVGVPGGNTIVAGNPFFFTAQATDQFGNSVATYNGPTSIMASTSPPDPQSNFPITGALSNSGFGLFLANLTTAVTYTLTTTAGSVSGTSGSLTVTPSAANYFTVIAPAAATTGSPFNVTVTAFDHFGNVATGYVGTVKLTSTDPAAAGLVNSYAFTTGAGKDNGVHTFTTTLLTGGNQTITATDTTSTNPTITGTSSAITIRGLTVTGFTPTATGFTVNFSEPFTVAAVNLYGGSQASPLQDVTLVGASSGPVNGSFVVDPSGTSATFKASSIFLSTFFQSSVLPDDTWTATLVSGTGTGSTAHGFFDALSAPLDGGNNAGHDNYTTSFTTTNGSKEALSIPDFARGPDGASTIKVPNDSAKGIPVTLSNVPAASGVTDVVFMLTYNPTQLVPTAGGTGDSSGTGSTFVMGTPVSVDATHSTVTFTWHDAAAQSGTVVLGDILANVPNSAANEYKSKEILSLSSIKVNGADFTGVWANGLHVNAYFGDVTGDGKISGLDVATAGAVAGGSSAGLSAFKLVDPAVVGDIAGDASIDATAVSDLASLTSNLSTGQIPAIPIGLTITPGGPDPTLSLGQVGRISNPSYGGIVSVPVLLDDPHPDGSTGMEEAVLALTYDPKVLTVSSADITLGSIPTLGTGWHLVSVVDQATGQIGIDLYSTTAISRAQAGSLVNIAFHVVPGASVPATAVQLVNSVAPSGRHFTTEVADDQGQYVLSPGLDRLVIQTGISPLTLVEPGRADNAVPALDIHGQVLLDPTKRVGGTGEGSRLLLGNEVSDGLAMLNTFDGELAIQANVDTKMANPVFQIGTLPLLNTLLFQNSPRQLATDKLFLALGRCSDAVGDAGQDDFWRTSIWHQNGNALSLEGDAEADFSRRVAKITSD